MSNLKRQDRKRKERYRTGIDAVHPPKNQGSLPSREALPSPSITRPSFRYSAHSPNPLAQQTTTKGETLSLRNRVTTTPAPVKHLESGPASARDDGVAGDSSMASAAALDTTPESEDTSVGLQHPVWQFLSAVDNPQPQRQPTEGKSTPTYGLTPAIVAKEADVTAGST